MTTRGETTPNSHPLVPTCVSTRGLLAACIMGGIKEDEKNLQTIKKKAGGEKRHEIAGQRDGTTLMCVAAAIRL